MGFGIHVLGAVADGCFAIRIYYKPDWFNYTAIVLEVFYTLLYVVWLIWIQVVRFRESGRICSGQNLETKVVTDSYAVKQGEVLLVMIIAIYAANIFITICAVIAGIVTSSRI